MPQLNWIRASSLAVLAVVLSACGGGGGGGGGNNNQTTTYTVGGTVTGLTQGSVVLRLNGANDLTVSANASGNVPFTFSAALANSASYTVSIQVQPNGASSAVPFVCGPAMTNATGTISGANVTNVALACASYSVGGTLSGLKAGSQLTLWLNGPTRSHTVAANGAFTFPTASSMGIGVAYAIAIAAQPAGQTCMLEGGLGIVRAIDPNVTTAALVCVDNVTDALSGTYQVTEYNGASAASLHIRDFATFYSDGTFIFGLHERDNTACGPNGQGGVEYGVYNWDDATQVFRVVRLRKLTTAPLECGLDETTNVKLAKRSDGSLFMVDAAEGDTVVFTPVPSTANELTGSWGDNLWFTAYAADGTFFNADTRSFPPAQVPGTSPGVEDGCYTLSGSSRVTGSFTVNLTTSCALGGGLTAVDQTGAGIGLSFQAAQQRNFTVTGDTLDFALVPGSVALARAGRITVAPASASTFSVSGTINGLTGNPGVTLRLNGQVSPDFTAVRPSASTTFTFAARLEAGASYSIGVLPQGQPTTPAQFCRPTAFGAGTIPASDVTNVVITCSNSASYSVSGNVTGLAAGASVTVRARYYDVSANGGAGAFAFADRVAAANGPYATITMPANVGFYAGIVQQPVGQTCTILRGTSFSFGAAIANLDVTCVDNVTGPLRGTYSFLDADGRGYVNFNADGTVTTALIHRNPDPANQEPPADCGIGIPAIDQRSGNGVEYGIFNWNQTTNATQLLTPAPIDTNGDCGFYDPNEPAGWGAWAIVTRTATGIDMRTPPGDPDPFQVTVTAVESVPGSLVGAWVPEANNGMLLVFHADGTFMLAETQLALMPPAGYGQERGCYTVSTPDSTIALTIATTCRPDGLAAYDLNGVGGAFANAQPSGQPNPVTSVPPALFSLVDANTLDYLGRIFKRTTAGP